MIIDVWKAYCGACEGLWYELDGEHFKQCPICGASAQEAVDLGVSDRYAVDVDKYTGEVELSKIAQAEK